MPVLFEREFKSTVCLGIYFCWCFLKRCRMPCLALAATSNLSLPLERVDCTKHSAQMFNQHSAISIQPRCPSCERQTKPSMSNTALTKHSRPTNEGMLQKTIRETLVHILKLASIILSLICFPFYVIFSLQRIIVSSG